jgi:asparagine synthase (glutamine-hydrolysing)
MCGIAGFLNLDGAPVEPGVLNGMIGTLEHRGPDGSGTWTRGPVALGHRRLSIIDLACGHQPMTCDEGSLSITFNGEIFNYVELREELLQKGHTFRTRSDTEVILRLYQEYGPECVSHMNGQWAFAIWDERKRRLFASRDRMGVLPLFHTMVGRTFVFGSEVKALLAYPGVHRELDLEALRQVFTFWFPLAPRTVFKNVFELPAAHSMIIEDGEIKVYRYWELDFSIGDSARLDSPRTEESYLDELCDLILDSTRLRLRADVPVGAYLSGGLDSSITSALAQRFVGSSLCTFSVAFEDPALDESSYQMEVAARLGSKHETIRCSSADIGEVFPEVIRHAERPILRTAPAPLFMLSKLVHDNGFKVVLTGEGSDEFLGGYDIFKEAKIRAFWGAQIDSKYRPLLLKRLYPYLPGLQKQPLAYLRAFFHVSPEALADPFFSHVPRWDVTARAQALFSPAVRSALGTYTPYEDVAELVPREFSNWSAFSRAQYLEAAFLLPGYLLSSQGDRVSMAHSVEARYPFLDHRVAEFSTIAPARLKMKVLNEKYLLKRAFGDLVPASVRERPKQPYRAPDAISFFDPETGRARQPYVEEALSPESIRASGVFAPGAVEKLVERAKSGRTTDYVSNAALVGVLSTQLVVDEFISKRPETVSHATDRTGSTAVCG